MTTGSDRILVQNRVDFVTGAVRRYVPDVNGLTDVAERVQSLFAGPYTNDPLSVPAEGEWTALRTLGHMIAYAQMLHDQLDRMAHMTDPELWRMDDAGIAEREDWESRSSQELVQLFVDGGMADNIRPAMYDSRYELLSAERPQAPAEETVTIAGKYCESGDLLVRDIELPRLRTGEIVAMPAAGAYQLAMASNYNLAQRPTVLLLSNGEARLLRRRETTEDLMLPDIDP